MVLRYLMTRTWMSIVCLVVAIPEATRAVFALGYRLTCHVSLSIDGPECYGPAVIFRQGANIDLACRVVAFSGFATLLVAFVLWSDGYWGKRKPGRGLAVLLVLEAAALTVAIGLVLADSATYVARIPGTGYAEVSHVPGLIGVPAVTLVFLLLRAFGAWKGVERPDPTRRRRSNWVPLS